GYAAIKNQDNFSYFLFANKEYSSIPPTKHLSAVRKAVEEIISFDPIGKVGNFEVLTQRLFKIKRKSIIFIISDFFQIPQLKVLAKKHEVVAIIVRDRFEEEPVSVGFINLFDPETKENFLVDLEGTTLKNYKKEVKRVDRELYESFKKSGVRFTKIYTFEDPFIKLLKLFGQK
ncbi:MAG: DUF58 domain-containing protein, partial [Epsilonproteobacteria bacterium]|nr:DUF58 domain-containing protein [Campylobacterota bacterium]